MGLRGTSYNIALGNNTAISTYGSARAAVDNFLLKDFLDLGGKNNPMCYRGRVDNNGKAGSGTSWINGRAQTPGIWEFNVIKGGGAGYPPTAGGENYARVLVCRDAGEAASRASVTIGSYSEEVEGESGQYSWWNRSFLVIDGGNPFYSPAPGGSANAIRAAIDDSGMINMSAPSLSRLPGQSGESVW